MILARVRKELRDLLRFVYLMEPIALPRLTTFCSCLYSLNWLGHLFDIFSLISLFHVFYTIFWYFGCITAIVWVATLFMFSSVVIFPFPSSLLNRKKKNKSQSRTTFQINRVCSQKEKQQQKEERAPKRSSSLLQALTNLLNVVIDMVL